MHFQGLMKCVTCFGNISISDKGISKFKLEPGVDIFFGQLDNISCPQKSYS